MKLFSKSFERRRLFEKSRHPKTFIIFINGLFSDDMATERVSRACRPSILNSCRMDRNLCKHVPRPQKDCPSSARRS
ncbi:hypothetical protein C3920_01060 [Novacetimonas pomaceti]|uniref:Uncharacterized protein n=1 Tax=Novacetimonas pomaceti TaxID=2021998 RepID=A0ABX5P5P1_9PROT|nr:hypothetical protein C3920_01060 [Novacetimonas pomaceti]